MKIILRQATILTALCLAVGCGNGNSGDSSVNGFSDTNKCRQMLQFVPAGETLQIQICGIDDPNTIVSCWASHGEVFSAVAGTCNVGKTCAAGGPGIRPRCVPALQPQ